MNRLQFFIVCVLVAGLAGCSPGGEPLPKLGIDIDKTSVSGLSAGAYMAGQLQVAHSNSIVGAGIVAGGPYGCAETNSEGVTPSAVANAVQALEACMSDNLRSQGIPNVDALVARAEKLASRRKIDPLQGLAEDKVYFFSGAADRIVALSVVEAARDFDMKAGLPESNIKFETRNDAGHAFLTEDTGTACGASASPFLSDCDYDQAGAILRWIYGDLKEPLAKPAGRFVRFDQSEFVKGTDADMSSEGVIYIPSSCSREAGCRLHIALHGCEQNIDAVGMTFVEGSGFVRWADTNRFVVLFPQVSASLVKNPKGCWDWWGYSGSDYFTKDASQIAAIWSMVERLAMSGSSARLHKRRTKGGDEGVPNA
ncbi:MAG TPA: PHB depolymerase family esterase [Methyloceanibacter sp.]|nr:PHB depolymerase family esterase [Methyloceanibacter sp.]